MTLSGLTDDPANGPGPSSTGRRAEPAGWNVVFIGSRNLLRGCVTEFLLASPLRTQPQWTNKIRGILCAPPCPQQLSRRPPQHGRCAQVPTALWGYSVPMEQPLPDTKDWTWTTRLRCPDCGLQASDVDVPEVADRLEAAAAEWVQILTQNPAADRRPSPRVWSPLEYGAHVRDVVELYDARLVLMLVEDDPAFKNWDQDEAAIVGDYQSLDPDEVAAEVAGYSATLVARIRALEESQFDRRGTRSDGAEFTVRTFLQYLLHDVVHHLWDVTGQQAEA